MLGRQIERPEKGKAKENYEYFVFVPPLAELGMNPMT